MNAQVSASVPLPHRDGLESGEGPGVRNSGSQADSPMSTLESAPAPASRPQPGCSGARGLEPRPVEPIAFASTSRRRPRSTLESRRDRSADSPAADSSPLEERDDMPTSTTVRRITPPRHRNFGRIYDDLPGPRPDRDPDPQLRAVPPGRPPGREARRRRPGRGLPRDLPDRELRQDAQARIHQVRPGQAALRARRVPPAPPDLRPAAPRLAPAQQGRDRRSRNRSTSATCRS